jgi:NAD(P)-dependent dehydrogenase (short-subunit alcohol dehydrogenase family)
MGKLDGKVAAITGAASGIGRGTARLFVAEGARVVLGDVEDERGQRVAEELGEGAHFLHVDVTKEDDVRAMVGFAVNELGRLDCIFNNAGTPGVGGLIDEIPVEGWDETVAVHLRGVFLGMKHAAQVMRKQGSGSIISTASVAGIQAGFGGYAYSAAKAAIIHLTRCVAMDLGASGVRVNCICPGGITTGIFGRGMGLDADQADQMAGALSGAFTNVQPIQRAGVPEDIAHAALWLASDDSGFVNGHAMVVDGGLTGGRRRLTDDPSGSPLFQALQSFMEEQGLKPPEAI